MTQANKADKAEPEKPANLDTKPDREAERPGVNAFSATDLALAKMEEVQKNLATEQAEQETKRAADLAKSLEPTTWRVGRKLGRTIYVNDEVIGIVDTKELAQQIVDAMNAKESNKSI